MILYCCNQVRFLCDGTKGGVGGLQADSFNQPCYCYSSILLPREEKPIFPLHTGRLPSMRTPKSSATCLAPWQSFSPLATSPVPTLERHSTAVLCWGFCGPQKEHFSSIPSPYFLPPLPRGPLILQHLTQEISEQSSSLEPAADLPGKVPLDSGPVPTC